jgi:hypothetical protein
MALLSGPRWQADACPRRDFIYFDIVFEIRGCRAGAREDYQVRT